MATKVSASAFAEYVRQRIAAKDGYLWAATGQFCKDLTSKSSLITQYKGNAEQHAKALYWLAHAERVHDCNGVAEGYYKDQTGAGINTTARNNYASWCDPKGTGRIPANRRVPGAAVFTHSASAGRITHVGYLLEPVKAGHPEGDWYVGECAGVLKGMQRSKLYQSRWNRWGWMSKYFYYEDAQTGPEYALGDRTLQFGDAGPDVRDMQAGLIEAGFSCGKYGADGEFGRDTESAVEAFRHDAALPKGKVFDRAAFEALMRRLDPDAEHEIVTEPDLGAVLVTGNTVYVRASPGTYGAILGVVRKGGSLVRIGADSGGWRQVSYNGYPAWISGKYTE